MAHKGLTSQQAHKLLLQYGENVLPEQKRKTRLGHFVDQFSSPLIYILVFAGVITFLLKDYTDSVVIMIAVFVNTLLGYYQEIKAEEALAALTRILSPTITVLRDNEQVELSVKEIVPGDIVVLGQGDKIPADGKLIEAVSLATDEAILTGESSAVQKKKNSEVYMGSTILSGRGVLLVETTGEETKMGSIAGDLVSVEDTETPLQIRLDKLARTLAIIVLALSLLILVIGLISGRSFIEMFTTSVALAVASIPEGLAISLTVILATGMQRILKRKALVRKLVAAETLGSVTVIATDKTGTLTEGLMRVTKTDVTNEDRAIRTATHANNLEDPLEIALWEWARKKGYDPQSAAEKDVREKEIPFDSKRRYMSVTIDGITYVKGAPEVVMKMTDVSAVRKKAALATITRWSSSGLRIVGLAQGKGKKLKWVGLVGFEDPVRKDLKSVFKTCLGAGLKVKMITGDHAGTAQSIWKKVYPMKTPTAKTVDGFMLGKMSDAELGRVVQDTDIFARVAPDQKLRIVAALQKNNEVVALVGDGVNDSPAIKKADVGIVVGDASDVAKETADMVLLDSNFKTIIAAIEEGRGIYQNMKKVILYLLSDSAAEIILVIGSIILGLPLPLTAAQILWINVVTDGLPAISLTFEPKGRNLLKKKPIDRNAPLVSSDIRWLIFIVSSVTGILSLGIFIYFHGKTSLDEARAVTFAALAIGTLVYIFSVRSLSRPIWHINQFRNPFLLVAVGIGLVLQMVAIYQPTISKFLSTYPIGVFEWTVVFSFSVVVILLIELTKWISTARQAQTR